MSPGLLDIDRDDDAHTTRRLTDETIIWFGSTRPDGHPHQVPVWFWWRDPEIVVFSTPSAQKLRNIRHEPAVVLHLDTAARGGDVVLLEGSARQTAEEAISHLSEGFAGKYAPLLGPSGVASWRATFAQPILITVTRVVAWTRTNGELAYRSVPPSPKGSNNP
jgi:PPOX class probable F420-dependent enzyme